MDYAIEVGKRLQKLRMEKGYSQDELAEMIGTDKRKISRFETGCTTPDCNVLIKLSEIFDTSIDYILFNTSERKRYPKRKRTIFKLFQK